MNPQYTHDVISNQLKAKANVHKLKWQQTISAATDLKQALSSSLKRAMDLAQEKGASSWLTLLPIEEFAIGFSLHKGAIHDALALRYDGLPSRIPLNCACGTNFTVEHALHAPKVVILPSGTMRSETLQPQDLTAALLTEVCHDVRIEPDQQPITGKS